jgi:hypothetical protein
VNSQEPSRPAGLSQNALQGRKRSLPDFVAHTLQPSQAYRQQAGLPCGMGSVIADKGDHVSFSGRIRAAMTRCSWPTKRDGRDIAVLVLRSKWAEFFKGKANAKTPSRPTFYDWLRHKEPKISPKNLFLLSDLLNVNARWLALNQGSMSKPITPDMEIQTVVDAWNNLSPAAREELVKEAEKLLRVQGTTSAASPFKTSTR